MRSKARATSIVALSLAGLLAAGATASVLDSVDCSALLETRAAEKLFDELAADRAALESLESDPPVLVWLEYSAECQGRSQLRVMYRSEASRPEIEEILARPAFGAFGPVKLTNG
jgi:hypothetical protein